MNQIQALYRLQTLESSLDQAKARLQAIEAQLKNNATVLEATAALETCTQEQHQAQGKFKDLELELAALTKKIADTDEMLYSGRITNPRELQEREAELTSLKNRKAKLEGDVLAAREVAQKAGRATEEARAFLQATQEEAAQQNQGLIQEDDKLRHKMTSWLKERKTVLESIDEPTQKLYKKLKSLKNGVAVVRLEDNACSFCKVEQTQTLLYQVRHNHAIVQCHSCARILVEI